MSDKLCLICLKRENEANVFDSSAFIDFFIQIIGVKKHELENRMWLCVWCKASLKRAAELIEHAKESQRILAASNHINNPNTKLLKKQLHQLSYHNNSHVDIPPVYEETKESINIHEEVEEYSGIEERTDTEQDENEIEINTIDETICNKNLNKTNVIINSDSARKRKKDINFKEMMFEVKFLDFEEQVKEIELKKCSEKYQSMGYHCDDCGLGFLTDDVLEKHNSRHKQAAGSHTCDVCHLRFKSKNVLCQHTLAHRRRFVCLICKGIFKRWGHCIGHRYKCGGVKSPAVCEDCRKVFSDPYSLDVHIKGVHKRVKRHACERCDKLFATKHRLHIHLKTHTLAKQFACPTCSRAFSTRSNMVAHASVHAQARRHYCVECDTRYKTAKGLRRHFVESARHLVQEDLVHKCVECSKRFSTKRALDSHTKAIHLTSYRCSFCTKTFSNNASLRKHMRIHSTCSKTEGKPTLS